MARYLTSSGNTRKASNYKRKGGFSPKTYRGKRDPIGELNKTGGGRTISYQARGTGEGPTKKRVGGSTYAPVKAKRPTKSTATPERKRTAKKVASRGTAAERLTRRNKANLARRRAADKKRTAKKGGYSMGTKGAVKKATRVIKSLPGKAKAALLSRRSKTARKKPKINPRKEKPATTKAPSGTTRSAAKGAVRRAAPSSRKSATRTAKKTVKKKSAIKEAVSDVKRVRGTRQRAKQTVKKERYAKKMTNRKNVGTKGKGLTRGEKNLRRAKVAAKKLRKTRELKRRSRR